MKILANRVGTDAAGLAPVENNGDGIEIRSGVSSVQIGGPRGGEANVIAGNAYDGVAVAGATLVPIRGNAIFGNGKLGIDLQEGGNASQPAPVLRSAVEREGSVDVSGALHAAPNATHTIDYYASPEVGSSEGVPTERWLAEQSVRTDAGGTRR
ncbi:MAG: hypothetical protein ACYCUM_12700 [Solirubrobacteraceae bacterium]